MGGTEKSKEELLEEVGTLRRRLQDLEAAVEADGGAARRGEPWEQILTAQPGACLLLEAEEFRVENLNGAALELYGYGPEELRGLRFADLAAEPSPCERVLRQVSREQNQRVIRGRQRKKDGTLFPAEVTAFGLTLSGEQKVWAAVRDVSQGWWARHELLRIGAAMDGALDAVLVLDVNGKATYANRAFRDLFGRTREDIARKGMESLFEQGGVAGKVVETALEGSDWAGEVDMVTAEERRFTALVHAVPIVNGQGGLAAVLLLISDVTQQKQVEERLVYEATHDALTGLYNRRFLMSRLSHFVSSARRYEYPLSLSLCDLDGFKAVNDTYGHGVGDDVLARFGEMVREKSRADDMAGRYGGDEFWFLLPHTAVEEALHCVERFRAGLEKMVFQGRNQERFVMTATFGVADLGPEHRSGDDLLRAADRALYRAKARGRNCVATEEGDAR